MKVDRFEADQARVFNEKNPIGTAVRVYRGRRGYNGIETRTRTEAQLLSGHTAVVWVDGVAGCIALSHVEVLR